MSYFTSPSPVPPIPDNLTIPQFIFNTHSPVRPLRPQHVPWLIHDDSARSSGHAELTQRTRGLANTLRIKWNIGAGDAVCIFSPNNIDYPVCIWAVHSLGGTITPANPGYKADELAHQLCTTKATLLIVHPASLSVAQAAAREVGLADDHIIFIEAPPSPAFPYSSIDELVSFGLSVPVIFTELNLGPGEAMTRIAFLSFSSGTTGKPKAVAISHYSVIANVTQMVAHYKLNDSAQKNKRMSPGDVAAAVLPFFHIYGLVVNLHFLLFAGLSIVVMPKFHFGAFLDSIVRHRITHLMIVPPQAVLLCKHPSVRKFDFSHVKYCMSGAAPLSGELMESLRKVLPNAVIGQGYGLTETCTTVAMIPPHQQTATVGSAGQLIPGVIAKVIKQDGSLAVEGEHGELVVTGPSMALRYVNNETATKETFVNGWVHTGDEVTIRNGEVFVVDRLKEIMKVRGFQVAPAELEGHLLLHPDVADACVVSILDDYSGELPLAYIVLSETARRRVAGNAHAAKLLKDVFAKYVADAKVHYKRLAGGVEFVNAIPKNPSGKMLRRVLRDQARKMKGCTDNQAKL